MEMEEMKKHVEWNWLVEVSAKQWNKAIVYTLYSLV